MEVKYLLCKGKCTKLSQQLHFGSDFCRHSSLRYLNVPCTDPLQLSQLSFLNRNSLGVTEKFCEAALAQCESESTYSTYII